MAEYIEREAIFRAYMDLCIAKSKLGKARKGGAFFKSDLLPETEISAKEWVRLIMAVPAADVAQVRHGRRIEHEETPDDAYLHHKCSECNVNAPFDYKMREDWDEGMDGEWDSLGLVDDGINEHLTDYCPNCGAKMMEG